MTNQNFDKCISIIFVVLVVAVLMMIIFSSVMVVQKPEMPLRAISSPVEPISEDTGTVLLSCIDEPEDPLVAAVEDTEVVVEIEVFEEKTEYFDIPLDENLQDHIFALCEEAGIDPEVVIAMIKAESNFEADIIGDRGNAFGLMQIWPKWHKARMDRLGCTDLLDPYQNVTVGVDILKELLGRGKGMEWALMAYNAGWKCANEYDERGAVTVYVTKVRAEVEDLVVRE